MKWHRRVLNLSIFIYGIKTIYCQVLLKYTIRQCYQLHTVPPKSGYNRSIILQIMLKKQQLLQFISFYIC